MLDVGLVEFLVRVFLYFGNEIVVLQLSRFRMVFRLFYRSFIGLLFNFGGLVFIILFRRFVGVHVGEWFCFVLFSLGLFWFSGFWFSSIFILIIIFRFLDGFFKIKNFRFFIYNIGTIILIFIILY